jgi:uncharacterized protein (UPF0332 family)/ASC-1-like (ASCH) protein
MDKHDDKIIGKRLYEQIINNWIVPEIKGRKKRSEIKTDFKLRAAQVIFSIKGPISIRLNDEVRALLEMKPTKVMKKDDKVLEKDIEQAKALYLLDEEKEFGHITMVKIGREWLIGFSFDYDLSSARGIYSIALEFFMSASQDLQQKRYRPFIEAAFIAAENLGKAKIILSLPDGEIRGAKKHGTVAGKINIHARANKLIKSEFAVVFNKLQKMRDKARYDNAFEISEKEANEIFGEINYLEKEIGLLLARFANVEK